ncbi:MAG: hypothetical protein HRU03_03845 [Nanoarchaeales archaeon]|nr:hypothetical protein [Nanoarchaeales archaeon]
MHYIKDLFEGNMTEHLHNKFIRYSRGDFVGPLLKLKFAKANVKIYASFHFTDELLAIFAEKIGNNEVRAKGTIFWNKDLSPEFEKLGLKFIKVSKARGIFKYTIDNDVVLKDLVKLMDKYYVLLNIKHNGLTYSTKKALPKPNKEFGADFCKLTLPGDMKDLIIDEFVFDLEDRNKVKLIEISHQIKVTDIVLPEGEKDFDIARRQAKRVGKIERVVTVDGEENLSERVLNV